MLAKKPPTEKPSPIQRMIGSLIILGTVLGVQVGAEPMMDGQVRLASGEPVAGAHVRLFDLRDLRAWVGTTTDETGYFALPLGALPGAAVQPQQFHLGENYPNPFNPATVIPYQLQQSMLVRLEVFNVLGQHVATLVDGQQASGFHTARWDGTNAAGQAVAAGVYLYRLSGEGVQVTRSMVLIDGQAGVPAGSAGRLPQAGAEATEGTSVYGLTVSGPGLMPFVDPAFEVASGPVTVELVEASVRGSRAKLASSGGILGDVDNNGRVDFSDALFVVPYSEDSTTVLPNNGDISLGDVNADGRIDFTDAYLIASWLHDPSDPTLPAGIGAGKANASDRDVLVALFEATDGDNWTNNTNWLSEKPLEDWFGVETDAGGRVTQLDLRENNLIGTIPAELGDLTNLRELELRENELSGSIPQSLGQLQNLEILNLRSNQLSGSLPPVLGQLQNLKKLYLYDNQLSGSLPQSLGQLQNLEVLNLRVNRLSGSIPQSLGQLQNLEVLNLRVNRLSGPLPASLVNLTYLEWLVLQDTQLCAPTDAGFQTWLKGIENKRGVVNCTGDPGDLPEDPGDELDDRAVLAALYEATDGKNWEDNSNWLSDEPLNEWDGVTTDNNGRVTRLVLRVNGLSGSIPQSLGQLQNLTYLDLRVNGLSGSIPQSLGQLQNLEVLNLRGNRLSGSIPQSLGQLQNLKKLYLYDNQLSGLIPQSLGQLQNLEVLNLRDNGLSGPLPASLVNLTHLEWLVVEDTQLCVPTDAGFQRWLEGIENKRGVVNCTGDPGDLPEDPGDAPDDRAVLVALYEATDGKNWEDNTHWLSDEPLNEWDGVTTNANGRVTRLVLRDNGLSGSLPQSLGQLQNLTYLDLRVNGLSGSIPQSLGQLQNLEVLNLRDNGLSGPLPQSLGQLQNLKKLYLYDNQLSGLIPQSLGQLQNLEVLNLRDNGLSGPLPASLVNLTYLEWLVLEDTQLCVPTDAGFQRWLEGIDNKRGVVNCTGDPGAEPGDRAALVALYEATNGDNWENNTNWKTDRPLDEWDRVHTDGEGRVTALVLYNNQLSGSIPQAIGQLQNLTYLDLGSNELSGSIPQAIGQLQNLEDLRLHDNRLSGAIPQAIGQLKNLRQLWLNSNQLSGSIPQAIGQLQNLEILVLLSNGLSGSIPQAIGQLQNLTRLSLGANLLSGSIPQWLGQLKNLTFLGLSSNRLSGSIPQEIGQLKNLQGLDLRFSQLSGALPSSLVNLTNLEGLWLEDTQLCAPTAAAFQRWLEGIDDKQGVEDCEEPGPDPDRAVLVALYEAMNGDNWENNTNWMSDEPLDEWYGVGTDSDGRVTSLDLRDNRLSGSIPQSLGQLQNLETLDLRDNRLSGSIPQSLGQLQNLTRLILDANQLSGSIPQALGQLHNLEILGLRINQLSGSIPQALGQLHNLQWLVLSYNQLSGALPSSLVNLTNLEYLWLEDTQLCAPTDAAFQTWLEGIHDKRGVEDCGGGPQLVSIPDANLRAAIESALGKARGASITEAEMASLTSLEAPNKNIRDLTGLEFATDLTWLDLGYKYVSHAVYESGRGDINSNEISDLSPLSGLTNLRWLELDSNNISDVSALSSLTHLTSLNLSGNPILDVSALSSLTNLTGLYLVENRIWDVSALSSLTYLTYLHLSSNSISDVSALSGLTSLSVLSLWENSVSDISPLVANAGLGNGDWVDVGNNPLSATSLNTHIPALQNRGVEVQYDAPKAVEVSIPDANLRAAIESALGKTRGASITEAEMVRLTHLEAPNSNISDLTGLEYATGLTFLNLGAVFVSGEGWVSNNDISDLSPLSGLTNLTTLWLDHSNISDVSVLSNLTNLTGLGLSVNRISDVSVLSNLTNLTGLNLWGNRISDVSALSNLTNLTWLVLGGNAIANVSPLSGLYKLTQLHLWGNRLTSVDALFRLTNLKELILADNRITDVSTLFLIAGSWDDLTTLSLANNRITDIAPLVAISGLGSGDVVNVKGNPLNVRSHNTHIPALQNRGVEVHFDAPQSVSIPDANLRAAIEDRLGKARGAPITTAEMASMTSLRATSKNIRNLTGLEHASGLTLLILYNNSISDVSPLSALINLTDLHLSINSISDVSALSGLTSLTGLDLKRNSISDASVLSGLTNLESLYLDDNNISDVSALSGLTNLEYLHLGSNSISNISPLSGLTNLTDLWLFNNNISDVSALSGLTNLTQLALRNNRISDLSSLVANTGLGSGDRVIVGGNPLSATSRNTHIPALQARGVEVDLR